MPDLITGIATVEPHKIPSLFRVCLALRHSDGRVDPCVLTFMDATSPVADADKLAGEPVWQFKKDQPNHGWLDCQPSVRQFIGDRETFHNAFNWQVQYVFLKYTSCDALYNIWKILNSYGEDVDGKPMPPVTAETFEMCRRDGYIY